MVDKVLEYAKIAAIGFPEEQRSSTENNSSWKAFLFVYLSSLLASSISMQLCLHQIVAIAIIGRDKVESTLPSYQAFMNDCGTAFGTFEHGAFHCEIACLFMCLLIIGTNALFEIKNWNI
jgi:hypothetical protein